MGRQRTTGGTTHSTFRLASVHLDRLRDLSEQTGMTRAECIRSLIESATVEHNLRGKIVAKSAPKQARETEDGRE